MEIEGQKEIRDFFRHHTYLVRAIGLVIVGLGLVILTVVPLFQRVSKLRSEIEAKNSKLERLKDKVVVLSNIDKEVVRERMEVLDAVLPPDKNVVAYLMSIDGLSRELGISFGGVSLNPGEIYRKDEDGVKESSRVSKQKWSYLETEVKLRGSSENVYEFMRQVENIAPLMTVRNVSMSRASEEGDVFTVTLSLAMVYARPSSVDTLAGTVELFNREEEELYSEIARLKRYQRDFTEEVQQDLDPRGNIFSSGVGSVTSQDQESSLQSPQTQESQVGTGSAQTQ